MSGRPQTRAREGLRSREEEDSALGTSEVFTHMCKYRREVREAGHPPLPFTTC